MLVTRLGTSTHLATRGKFTHWTASPASLSTAPSSQAIFAITATASASSSASAAARAHSSQKGVPSSAACASTVAAELYGGGAGGSGAGGGSSFSPGSAVTASLASSGGSGASGAAGA